ncbi:MAG: hypothetical protein AAB463_01905 [Patescibacteria group bacterium]
MMNQERAVQLVRLARLLGDAVSRITSECAWGENEERLAGELEYFLAGSRQGVEAERFRQFWDTLPLRVQKALENARRASVDWLPMGFKLICTQLTNAELFKVPNCGVASRKALDEALAEYGLRRNMDYAEYEKVVCSWRP